MKMRDWYAYPRRPRIVFPTSRKFGRTTQMGPKIQLNSLPNPRPDWGLWIFPERAEKEPNFPTGFCLCFSPMKAIKNWNFHRIWLGLEFVKMLFFYKGGGGNFFSAAKKIVGQPCRILQKTPFLQTRGQELFYLHDHNCIFKFKR